MSQNVYKKVDYTLQGLIENIKMGEIALPDLQRPFVWKNVAVRDLFDSLYRGYPVGFFLFWETDGIASAKSIGTASKQKPPKLLVVDGQQRLTSLYAVVEGVEVIRDNFKKEIIEIAFDPTVEKFDVVSVTTKRNKNFIPNISVLWAAGADVFDIAEDYVKSLRENREVSDDEARLIRQRLQSVKNLINTPFIALELSSKIDVEGVADVFVRINSKGKTLQQADFILTLMSVFWEEGRRDLEEFSNQTRLPSTGAPSAFNYFITPDPDMLLRAGIGLGFRRARLQYVYALLTGRDLEKDKKNKESGDAQFETLSKEDRRDAQFETLRKAQSQALNLQNWHNYLKCINDAGYRSNKMLSSKLNIIYCYIIYLIGRVQFNIKEQDLARGISQWFFMAALTGRYSSSPESKMESDLARFRDMETGSEFLSELSGICTEQLTDDFWAINLPSNLANSSASNTSMMSYYAALNLLGAKVLYSDRSVSDLLDPSIHSKRSAIERHHLFPRAFLQKKGVDQTLRNQTANYAIIEYTTNAEISDQNPTVYAPVFEERFSNPDLIKMYHWHALPDDWQNIEYEDFLQKRRELMAGIIKEGYETLSYSGGGFETPSVSEVFDSVKNGEDDHQEFKSTLRKNLHTGQNDPKMEMAVLKTISGFLNAGGGTLYVGIADDGTAVGLEEDGFPNEDKFLLHLTNLINARIGQSHNLYINFNIEDYLDKRALVVKCSPSKSAVWTKDGNDQKLFVRTGPSTSELKGAEAQAYIEKRF
ncbi:MAG: hypothetical protein COC03_02660 [Robiginitomaculum sp.]|nr:MAG: hypothetical protein COC03_02660 [Robiginitomaculum sp.]PHQ67554.1 MAG: hypothetical protein COB92_04205 [Robiginitomaculum sp.]